MHNANHPAVAEISLPDVLAAVSDRTRLGLVRLLADGEERAWGTLRAPVAKSTLSHHLKVLRDAGITRTRQDGTRCFVRLREDELNARFPGLLATLLAAAEADGVGDDVGLTSSERTGVPGSC